jgi:hypothetical protein
MEVPARWSWFASVRGAPGELSKSRHSVTICFANSKVRSGKSLFTLRLIMEKFEV